MVTPRRWVGAALCAALLAACAPGRGKAPPASPPAPSPAAGTPTPSPPGVWVQAGVPPAIAARALETLTRAGFAQVAAPNAASVKITLDPGADALLSVPQVIVLVAPFPTVADDVRTGDLKGYWMGSLAALPGFDAPPKIIVSADLIDMLTARLGKPGPAVSVVSEHAARGSKLVEDAWAARPAISFVPFDQLEPRWKALSVDGLSALDKKLDVTSYPLSFTVGVTASQAVRAQAVTLLTPVWPASNRDPSKIVTVIMTGTTALGRTTAWMMQQKGVDFPAQGILPFFSDRDLLHVSSEVSFTPKCPPPKPDRSEKFCSDPANFALFQHMGVNVVELTGNHNNDYGTRPDAYTLDLFDKAGLAYFGGGRTLEEAMTPRILTAPEGTRVAFVGCNSVGPYPAWATALTPGAAPCGDWGWITAAIHDLKANGKADVVIATVQYRETPSHEPEKQQVIDFQRLADAGADIVSGSQAHVAQGFFISDKAFIHYGVGNLFFDQMDQIETRQMFADKYSLYQGRVASVTLFTGIIEAYAQPRPMTEQERADFLKLIYQLSGW